MEYRDGLEVNLGEIVSPSTIDWHGKLSTVIFFRGCNMACPFCSNHRLLCGNNTRPIEFVMEEIDKASEFVDGIVFSGGEAILQTEAFEVLADYSHRCKLKVALHTNGLAVDPIVKNLQAHRIDALMVDMKNVYPKGLYVSTVSPLLAMAWQLRQEKALEYYEVRYTVFQKYNDKPMFGTQLRQTLMKYGVPDRIAIQRGRPELSKYWGEKKPVSNEVLEEIVRRLGHISPIAVVRG